MRVGWFGIYKSLWEKMSSLMQHTEAFFKDRRQFSQSCHGFTL